MAQTKIKPELIDGGVGTDWQSAIQTSNFTAAAGKGYFVDTTSGSITITLPAGVVGAQISIQDYAGTFDTNNVVLNANGSEKIQGDTISGQITTKNATTTLVYQDSIKGWTSQNVTLQTIDLRYLVVAGGGGGGSQSTIGAGGGGAGGMLTSTSYSLNLNTNYTVTVGGGGAVNTNGDNSVFATITATGGGRGGYRTGYEAGANGGSGGGSASISGQSGGTGTSGQGNDGGTGSQGSNFPSTYQAGGGGGAGEAGNTDGQSQGGDGLASDITGTSVTYAGGGAGAAGTSYGTRTGGEGGGGNEGSDGTDNLGGGGGANASGGSGVVILRYSNTKTITIGSGLTTSHLNTAISGTSDKYTRFTGGTGTISFS